MSKENTAHYVLEIVETDENHVMDSQILDAGTELDAAKAFMRSEYGKRMAAEDSVDPDESFLGDGQAEIRFLGDPMRRFWLEVQKLQGGAANSARPTLEVGVPQGKLIAEACADPDYPGIVVSLEIANGERCDLALVESDPSSGAPQLRAHLYGDPFNEEPTYQETIAPSKACVGDAGEIQAWLDAFSVQ